MCWVCDQLGLSRGDIIEIDAVNNATVKEHFRIESGMRGVVLPNDEYFEHVPEMLCGDRSHKVVVLQNHEPMGIMSLYNKMVTWRKVRGSSPNLQGFYN